MKLSFSQTQTHTSTLAYMIPQLGLTHDLRRELARHLGGRGRRISEFKARLVYRVSSRTAKATHRNPVLKTKQKQKQTNKQKDLFILYV